MKQNSENSPLMNRENQVTDFLFFTERFLGNQTAAKLIKHRHMQCKSSKKNNEREGRVKDETESPVPVCFPRKTKRDWRERKKLRG